VTDRLYKFEWKADVWVYRYMVWEIKQKSYLKLLRVINTADGLGSDKKHKEKNIEYDYNCI